MSKPLGTFRDFGVITDGILPPAESVRAHFSRVQIFGQYLGTALVTALGLGIALWLALAMPSSLRPLGCLAVLSGFGVFVYLAAGNDYGSIELQGNTLRAEHLYTGRTMVRSIAEIESLTTIVFPVRRLETVITEKLLGRVRGIDIRFNGEVFLLRVMRSDPAMKNAQELIEAIVYRMQQMGAIDCEIVDFAGKPLLRTIFWKDRPETLRRKPLNNLLPVGLILIALSVGTMLGFLGKEYQELRELASVLPQEIALSALVDNGPGNNRHVTIVDYRPGGFVCESRHGGWADVWVALFPARRQFAQPEEIVAVLHSTQIRDKASLGRLLRSGRLTGICSTERRSGWGATLGPELLKANAGCRLTSAWSIKELASPPEEAQVIRSFSGAMACFSAVLGLVAFVVWRDARIRLTMHRCTA